VMSPLFTNNVLLLCSLVWMSGTAGLLCTLKSGVNLLVTAGLWCTLSTGVLDQTMHLRMSRKWFPGSIGSFLSELFICLCSALYWNAAEIS
jgi:hypothetical protein